MRIFCHEDHREVIRGRASETLQNITAATDCGDEGFRRTNGTLLVMLDMTMSIIRVIKG